MKNPDIRLSLQRALIGEVPQTLRFIYAGIDGKTLNFMAVFTDDAPDDHLECASFICTEVLSDCQSDTELNEQIIKNSKCDWKINDGANLLYLRYGEMDGRGR